MHSASEGSATPAPFSPLLRLGLWVAVAGLLSCVASFGVSLIAGPRSSLAALLFGLGATVGGVAGLLCVAIAIPRLVASPALRTKRNVLLVVAAALPAIAFVWIYWLVMS